MPEERAQLLEVLQRAFKQVGVLEESKQWLCNAMQVIGSGAELDLALSTRWPLHGSRHPAAWGSAW